MALGAYVGTYQKAYNEQEPTGVSLVACPGHSLGAYLRP
jgi:hypothetical protein